MGSRPSFTLLELVVVIILLGILAYFIQFQPFASNLQAAADELIKDIRLTQSLALKDDKFQPFPVNDSTKEQNRSKYWFKQWWHLKITDVKNINTDEYEIIAYIFSDQPRDASSTNFDKKTVTSAQYTIELAKNLKDKYLIGANKEDTGNNNYPSKVNIEKNMNFTRTFKIIKIESNAYVASYMRGGRGPRIDLLFDNLGNIFQKEGEAGDGGDINPLENRELLTKNIYIRLCTQVDENNHCITNDNYCVQVNITPAGYIYKSSCN